MQVQKKNPLPSFYSEYVNVRLTDAVKNSTDHVMIELQRCKCLRGIKNTVTFRSICNTTSRNDSSLMRWKDQEMNRNEHMHIVQK